ncbi:probable E3 ubiquitin-protein ligase makorin-2 [Caerostris darwini]|uniref:Probable E3 ubiquitin-protein ligase makorin-2 n=1 Tax=Caerostris darwini TaxID=1538125 RepID=A0AAV4TJF0_9ARAC|nr:probable E3 ubiquitin-protein ligase makorin-2 [Caerostris darwini]
MSDLKRIEKLLHDKFDVKSRQNMAIEEVVSAHSELITNHYAMMNCQTKQCDSLVCEICKKVVLQKKSFGERRFGLLENCFHAFCLSCIRQHREKILKKLLSKKNESCLITPTPAVCPVCKAESRSIVSSNTWIKDKARKTWYFATFEKEMSTMACPWIKLGQGICLCEICSSSQIKM